MLKYGTDKPDLRNRWSSRMCRGIRARRRVVQGLQGQDRARNTRARAGAQPRSFFDKLNDWARSEARGLAIDSRRNTARSPQGPIAKFIPGGAAAIAAKAASRPATRCSSRRGGSPAAKLAARRASASGRS